MFERPRRAGDLAVECADALDHVGRGLDQRRAVADQLVAALGARIERRARHRHHLPPRFGRQPGGDQRTGLRRRLDHHRSRGQPGDDPVAVGEVARPRLGARRHFGDQQAALGNVVLPRLVFGRIEDVDPAGDDGDRAAFKRTVMRRAVDARGPGRRRRSPPSWPKSCASPRAKRQAAALALRAPTIATIGRSSSAEIALGGEQRRRIFQLGQRSRIKPLPQRPDSARRAFSTASISRSALSLAENRGRLAAAAPRRGPESRPARRRRCRSAAAAGDRRSGRCPACGSAAAGRSDPAGHSSLCCPRAVPRPGPGAGYFRDASRSPAARSRAASGNSACSPRTAAVTGALAAAAMPATELMRRMSSSPSQTTA